MCKAERIASSNAKRCALQCSAVLQGNKSDLKCKLSTPLKWIFNQENRPLALDPLPFYYPLPQSGQQSERGDEMWIKWSACCKERRDDMWYLLLLLPLNSTGTIWRRRLWFDFVSRKRCNGIANTISNQRHIRFLVSLTPSLETVGANGNLTVLLILQSASNDVAKNLPKKGERVEKSSSSCSALLCSAQSFV